MKTMKQWTWDEADRELARIEAECGCELPDLREGSLTERAQRVLECSDPPRGKDMDFCYRLLSGNAIGE